MGGGVGGGGPSSPIWFHALKSSVLFEISRNVFRTNPFSVRRFHEDTLKSKKKILGELENPFQKRSPFQKHYNDFKR